MKRCLTVVAHPTLKSFTNSLASEFEHGLTDAGHSFTRINLFQEDYPFDKAASERNENNWKRLISNHIDGIALIFPWWWEMPPAPMVAFLQNIFNVGFAFEYINGIREVTLDLPSALIISMGQKKLCNDKYLLEAMHYCGLHQKVNLVCQGVGPTLAEEDAKNYLELARAVGKGFL